MTFACCGCDTYNVRRCTDRCCTSSDIGTDRQCPCKNSQVDTGYIGCQIRDNRDHGRCEWNVIDKGTCHCRYDNDNSNHNSNISATDRSDKACQNFQNTGFLQTTYDNKQSDKEQQCFVIYFFRSSSASFPATINVTIAIATPIVDTVSPVCACDTRSTTAHRKIIQLAINPRLSVIASFGSG